MKLSSLFLLLEGKAFFPSVATLQSGDPLEGDLVPPPEFLTHKFQQECKAEFDSLLTWLRRSVNESERGMLYDPEFQTEALANAYIRELAKRRAVWCWFNAHEESAGMWSVYGTGGIAISTCLRSLESALPEDMNFQIAPIVYAARSTRSPLGYFDPEALENRDLIHRPHLIKGLEYKHECEVRVTTRCSPRKQGRLITSINPLALIERVLISPLVPHDEAEAIEAQISRHEWVGKPPSIERSSILGKIAEGERRLAEISRFFQKLGVAGEAELLEEPGGDLPPILQKL